jgi:hypothetical protein
VQKYFLIFYDAPDLWLDEIEGFGFLEQQQDSANRHPHGGWFGPGMQHINNELRKLAAGNLTECISSAMLSLPSETDYPDFEVAPKAADAPDRRGGS